MLKFVNEVPVYDFDAACVVITGLNRNGPVTCYVTKAAILQRAGLRVASAQKLLSAFAQHRLFFEDIACVLNVRCAESSVIIDESHIREDAFASWRPCDQAMPAQPQPQRAEREPSYA